MPEPSLSERIAAAKAGGANHVIVNDAMDPRNPDWQAAAEASKRSLHIARKKYMLLHLYPDGRYEIVRNTQHVLGQGVESPPRVFGMLGLCRAYAKLHGADGSRFLTVEAQADHNPVALNPTMIPHRADLTAFMVDAEFSLKDSAAGDVWDNGFGQVLAARLDNATWAQIAQALDLA